MRLRFLMMGLALVTILAGCATPPSRFGSHAVLDGQTTTAIATDTLTELTKLFPPALNRFYLQHSFNDEFGVTLESWMRHRGYALVDYVPPAPGKAWTPQGDGTSLAYTITQQGSNTFYLTLYVGSQQLSRIYVSQNGGAYPAGAWSHKE